MIASDIYVRYTDKDGKSHVMEHRVWDESLFMDARQEEQRLLGGRAEVVTRYEYRSMR